MNVQCVICKESIDVLNSKGDGGNNASALPCGHVFHSTCITRWFEQSGSNNLGSCPHCRCNVHKAKVLRIFLDLVPIANYHDDPTVIKNVNQCLKRDIEDLTDRLETSKRNTDQLSKVNSGLRERVGELERKLQSSEMNERMLSLTRTKLNKKTKELENALDETEKLRSKLTSLRSSNTILNGSIQDAGEELKAFNGLEKKDMALLVYTYKKDSQKLLKKHGDLLGELSRVQEENRKLMKDLSKTQEEKSILSRIVEVYKQDNQNRNEAEVDENFVDLTTPTGSTPVDSSSGMLRISTTPVVSTPKLASRLAYTSNKFRIPLKSSKTMPGTSSSPLKSPLINPPSLNIPENYDGLGGHSRLDNFPSKVLKRKIVTDRKSFSIKKSRPV